MNHIKSPKVLNTLMQNSKNTLAPLLANKNAKKPTVLVNNIRNITVTAKAKSSNIFNVQDEEDFKKRVLQNSKPVIVDFHAVWCGPCKILGPRLEKLMSITYNGKADFAKVDIDQLSDLAADYRISSVPTVIAIKNGKEVGKFVGLLDDDRIKKFVKEAIEK